MKLLIEEINDARILKEEKDGKQSYFIEGIFLQSKPNRNGRLYPFETLQNEVKRYNENFVSKKRAFGEFGHPACVTSESIQALTENGWKRIIDVSVGEKVLSINPKTKQVSYKNVTHITNAPYKGKVIRFKNDKINFAVTPLHKFVITKRDNTSGFITAEDIFKNKNESWLHHSYIPLRSNDDYIRYNHNLNFGNISIDFNLFCEFLGLYLAEGYTTKRKDRHDSYIVGICQKSKSKIQIIQTLIDKLPFQFTNHNGQDWRCYNKELAKYLIQLGDCYTKYVPKEIINNMGNDDAKSFLNWFILGDGRGNLGENYSRVDAFSVSEKLIDNISHIACLAGYGVKHFTETPKDTLIEGRLIEAKNKSPLHFVRFYERQGIYLDNRYISIEEENYDGNVYCLSVEDNETFLMKEEGQVSIWTGNTPTIQMERISHLIVDLRSEGRDFIGKAKIINEGYGKIAKALLDEGAMLGVSSRGVGSLQCENNVNIVQPDFMLTTAADIVADPSAPDAFVQGVMENVEWYVGADGEWRKKILQETKDEIYKAKKGISKKQIEQVLIESFDKLLKNINK